MSIKKKFFAVGAVFSFFGLFFSNDPGVVKGIAFFLCVFIVLLIVPD